MTGSTHCRRGAQATWGGASAGGGTREWHRATAAASPGPTAAVNMGIDNTSSRLRRHSCSTTTSTSTSTGNRANGSKACGIAPRGSKPLPAPPTLLGRRGSRRSEPRRSQSCGPSGRPAQQGDARVSDSVHAGEVSAATDTRERVSDCCCRAPRSSRRSCRPRNPTTWPAARSCRCGC